MFGIYFYCPHAVTILSFETATPQDIALSKEYVAVMFACFRCVLIRCCFLAVRYSRSQLPVLAMPAVRLLRSDLNFNSLNLLAERWSFVHINYLLSSLETLAFLTKLIPVHRS